MVGTHVVQLGFGRNEVLGGWDAAGLVLPPLQEQRKELSLATEGFVPHALMERAGSTRGALDHQLCVRPLVDAGEEVDDCLLLMDGLTKLGDVQPVDGVTNSRGSALQRLDNDVASVNKLQFLLGALATCGQWHLDRLRQTLVGKAQTLERHLGGGVCICNQHPGDALQVHAVAQQQVHQCDGGDLRLPVLGDEGPLVGFDGADGSDLRLGRIQEPGALVFPDDLAHRHEGFGNAEHAVDRSWVHAWSHHNLRA